METLQCEGTDTKFYVPLLSHHVGDAVSTRWCTKSSESICAWSGLTRSLATPFMICAELWWKHIKRRKTVCLCMCKCVKKCSRHLGAFVRCSAERHRSSPQETTGKMFWCYLCKQVTNKIFFVCFLGTLCVPKTSVSKQEVRHLGLIGARTIGH